MQTFMKGVFIRGYEDKNACNESVHYTPIILLLLKPLFRPKNFFLDLKNFY